MHAVSTLTLLPLYCTHPIANITEEPVIPSTCPQGSTHTKPQGLIIAQRFDK
eukprot:COSAG06_NODE_886_length_11771_cov_13.431203_10_plen_52_part_00